MATLLTISFDNGWAASRDVTMEGGTSADLFYNASSLDGVSEHATITDFNQAAGDRLSLAININAEGVAPGWTASTETVFNWLDSNHDGQLTGLQPDGTGDAAVHSDGTKLDLYLTDDTLTVDHVVRLDWGDVA